MRRLLSIAVTLIIILAGGSVNADDKNSEKAEVVGTVIARDMLTEVFNNLGHGEYLFIVRVDERGGLEPHHIKIHYVKRSGYPRLPDNFFEVSRKWRFLVNRKASCDGPIRGRATFFDKYEARKSLNAEERIKYLPAAEGEKIPFDKMLRCYGIEPKDVAGLKTAE